MISHVTIIPATTRSGAATIRYLLETNKDVVVRGIYRDTAKAPADLVGNPNFQVVQGNVADDTDLDFSKTDAVLYIPPVTYNGEDQMEFARRAAHNVEAALKKANVGRLILHSAGGTQHSSGIGVLHLNHLTDEILKNVVPETLVVRPGWFYEMWFPALKEIQSGKKSSFESTFSPEDHKIPHVSVLDIGRYCGDALTGEPPKASPHFVDMVGPEYCSSLDLKNAMEEVLGKKVTIDLIQKKDLGDFFAREHIPEQYVPLFVEMVEAMSPGGVLAESYSAGELVRGSTTLVDAFRAFVQAQ
jgi:uncharacterized protein YbjT (DUF2867 family)